jgi:uncharacterized SAM-binding protein YcdF (DUF218 family)
VTFGELKPLLAALALPPTLPLLLVLAGVLLTWRQRGTSGRRSSAGSQAGSLQRLGLLVALLGAAGLWLLSCNAVAVWLARTALPQAAVISPADATRLKATGVQAVVVLGGGVLPDAPEYGRAQPSAPTAARLRYGFFLAKAADLPLAFAGGVGWAAAGTDVPSEASTAAHMAKENGLTFRWLDADSRDTAENAARTFALLQPAGVQHIALVTHGWHMPRSQKHFEEAGFKVLPAPTGLIRPLERPLLEWLPSAHGLTASRQVLREWLALRMS